MINVIKASIGDDAGMYWLSLPLIGTSDAVRLPPGMMAVSVAVHPAVSQTARIEFTLSGLAAIQAGTARWIAWDLGNVSVSAADGIMSLASAIRGVSSGGTATLELVAR